jgi:RNA polymerase sigma-B factor
MTDYRAPEDDEARNGRNGHAPSGDDVTRDALIADHLGLAHQLARRYANRGESHDDLVQVASLALVKAADRFDPEREVKFSTFAVQYMVGELKRHFRDRGWAVRAPRRIQELYLELGHHIDRLHQDLGRAPTVPELAVAVGTTEDAVLEALEASQGYRAASLDAPDRTGQSPADALGTDDPEFANADDHSMLSTALRQLSPRDQVIVRLRFVDGLTQSEIAVRLGVSQMQVSRLLASSLRRLRDTFAVDGQLSDADGPASATLPTS